MIELTSEQRQAMARDREVPPRAVDPETQTTYVLIREETYNRISAIFAEEEDERFVRDMYPHVVEVFGKAGWDDPEMDVYNELDPRRQP